MHALLPELGILENETSAFVFRLVQKALLGSLSEGIWWSYNSCPSSDRPSCSPVCLSVRCAVCAGLRIDRTLRREILHGMYTK